MIDISKVQAIILAAGRGTRMKSVEKNKVMLEVGGKPMISYPVHSLKKLGVEKPIVVVGFAKESVMEYLGEQVEYAEQVEALGTAHAVKTAFAKIRPETEHVIVLYGDHATFYTKKILERLLHFHDEKQAAMTLITTHTPNPAGYGRILRDNSGKMTGIVEEKNATDEQKEITEINTGNAVYSMKFLKRYLPNIEKNPVSGEYYFTDIVELGFRHDENIQTYTVEDTAVALGVNTPEQLAAAEEEMARRAQER